VSAIDDLSASSAASSFDIFCCLSAHFPGSKKFATYLLFPQQMLAPNIGIQHGLKSRGVVACYLHITVSMNL
jgi:hypothetical protein